MTPSITLFQDSSQNDNKATRHQPPIFCGLSLSYLSLSYLSLALFLGCSDVIIDDPMNIAGETGSTAGATSPTAGVNSGGLSFGGMSGGGMSGGDTTIPAQCMPGQELGVCAICGINSTPIEPIDDPNCPYIPCEELTTYQTRVLDDGGRQCLQYVATPPTSRCKELGVCYTDPEEACTLNPEPEVLLVAYPGCNSFMGCEGEISPDASLKGPGEECHSLGSCLESGQCSAPEVCSGSKPDFVVKHCPNPDVPTNEAEGCDMLIDMANVPDLDEINCTLACATQNGCINGWDVNGECDRGGVIGCSNGRDRLICQCRGS